MGNKLDLYQKGISSLLIYLAISVLLLSACATPSDQLKPGEAAAPVIESIKVKPSPEQTVVEIISSSSAPYMGFKLVDPPRVVLDIRGMPGEKLPRTTEVNDGTVREIRFEKSKTQPMTMRMVVDLARAVDYKSLDRDNVITLTLTPKEVVPTTAQEAQKAEEKAKAVAAEPRIFFKPRPIKLNQILGVDFTMLEHGKSRLIVTTDKKARYDLKRKGPKILLLNIEEATIPPLLMRRLESTYFEGVVDRVKANVVDKRVSLTILLREMVPFHVKQTDTAISIDFSPTTIKPPEKKLVPLQVTERVEVKRAVPVKPLPAEVVPTERPAAIPGLTARRYTGTPMTMDFVNADVTNILRLIGEVSNLNIVWGPEVKGTVSMRLKNVPWDQALDLVLANNNLAKREVGNVIWITTRAQMTAFEAEEKRKRDELADERKKRLEESEKLGPLVTEYFPLDFADAQAIKDHIILSERGSVSVDARTNTIIVKDVAANIEEARKIVQRFDTPVKQIMIEARIVDATDDFTRDLGVRWNTIEGQRRENTGISWQGTPLWAPTNVETNFTSGNDQRYRGTFSSNAPLGWSPNLSFTFAKLTRSALGGLALDASLALAETEGKVRVISAPKVIASNGEQANISRGDIIFRDIVTADRIDTKEIEAVLSLTVTPTVSFNDFVSMDIEVTDDQASAAGDRKLEKKIETKLMVKSGETVVIGGIFKEEETNNEAGIPGLRKIPLLGWLFKAQTKALTRTELLIFLTPRVIKAAGKKI